MNPSETWKGALDARRTWQTWRRLPWGSETLFDGAVTPSWFSHDVHDLCTTHPTHHNLQTPPAACMCRPAGLLQRCNDHLHAIRMNASPSFYTSLYPWATHLLCKPCRNSALAHRHPRIVSEMGRGTLVPRWASANLRTLRDRASTRRLCLNVALLVRAYQPRRLLSSRVGTICAGICCQT